MANIMLTEKCNLRCPYCFADDFVCDRGKEIPFEELKRVILRIVRESPARKVGLIGGEPTLYSKFRETLEFMEQSEEIRHIVIFTNGILLNQFADSIRSDKPVFLINCNSPQTIGNSNFRRMEQSIEMLVRDKRLINNTMLGLNVYKKDQDFDFFIKLLKDYCFRYARISLVVPQNMEQYDNAKQYQREFKSTLLRLFRQLSEIEVVPNYDCNKVPASIWTSDEQTEIREMFGERIKRSNILHPAQKCSPTLDIDTQLNVFRCFGFSDGQKVKLDEFESLNQIKAYFVENIDKNVLRCHEECEAGCLRFGVNRHVICE